MAKLSPKELEKARKAGADVKIIPKEVSVNGLQDLVTQLDKMMESSRKSQTVMLAAIQQLTKTIRDKQMSSGTDLSVLVAAVEGLHQKAESSYQPIEYQLDFERDNRNLLKSGMRFKPVMPSMLN